MSRKHRVTVLTFGVCLIMQGRELLGQTNAAPSSQNAGTGSQRGSASASPSSSPEAGVRSSSAVSLGSVDPQFQGSVPQGQASSASINLTLNDAIARGLKANLGLLTSEQSSKQARAERFRALSGLLPTINGQVSAVEQQLNLRALGFNVSLPPALGFSIPTIVGPYGYQNAQASATVPLFDYQAISNHRAARENVKASESDIKNARDLVVTAVGYAYLQIIQDGARITATQAEVDADNAVYTNAVRRHDAGTAIGIDVLRSQVELKQRQQALLVAKNQFARDKLTLGRVIGLPPGQDFSLADLEVSISIDAVPLNEALGKAYENRPDFQAAKGRVIAAEFSLRAAKAERYPTLQASGFYGAEGLRLFTNSHGVFNATGSVSFNIFDGGRIKGDVLQAEADLQNRRNELANLRGQIDYDVRNALLDLESSRQQVDVATSNVTLAGQNLKQSQDRFAAGVTNTVEVVQAQQAVASANDDLISAQYQLNVAKIELVRGLGLAETGFRKAYQP